MTSTVMGSPFDAPLSSRLDENDAVFILDEVLVHLALGSNLGNRVELLDNACLELEKLPLKRLARSPVVESSPLLGMEQPEFLNQVVCGYTVLGPEVLLKQCLAIEARLDRVRGEHWGPRTMDIDIAKKLVAIWLETPFEGGRHQKRVDKLDAPFV